jgi:hypothetical protein
MIGQDSPQRHHIHHRYLKDQMEDQTAGSSTEDNPRASINGRQAMR